MHHYSMLLHSIYDTHINDILPSSFFIQINPLSKSLSLNTSLIHHVTFRSHLDQISIFFPLNPLFSSSQPVLPPLLEQLQSPTEPNVIGKLLTISATLPPLFLSPVSDFNMTISATFSSHGKILMSPLRKSEWANQPVLCKSVELFKNGRNQYRMSTNSNKFQCRALEIENKSSTKFHLDDVIESQQFDRETLSAIFEVAREMEKIEKNSIGGRSEILKGYLMATLFYEPSTRTRLSFESAMKRLGGEVLTTENAREFSSAAKGETLEDTIRTVEGYSDIIVMRHFESGAARRAATTASIPIINAGDGPGQHPTQALLDVYTIEREIGKLDGINVALVGDLAYGRTVRSLAHLLAMYEDVKIYFVSPDVVKMKDDIKDYLTSMGVQWEENADLIEVASKCDVVYQTRIQRERFGERVDLYEEARGKYIVDMSVVNAMQKHAVVMHPLPRLDEITVDVDGDSRAAYFRQAKNGLYIRMALLKLLLLGW